MAKEIERKFIVNKQKWQPQGEKLFLKQSYISSDPQRTVRIRISGELAYLTIKGKTTGMSRDEFEYKIPINDAEALMKLSTNPPVIKNRYKLIFEGRLWEVDEFMGKNSRLLMAEVELISEDEKIILPDWIESEVTNDKRFYNSYLANFPYNSWDGIK